MRLLIVTQVVDSQDPVLGFFHAWIEALAERCERVEVVCLWEGKHALPENVSVHSLGKERGARPSFIYALRFYRALFRLRGTYDSVLVHMNPEYVCLAGWLWRVTGKRVVLWYVHKSVDLKLWVANIFASAIATASEESLRLSTGKKRVLGHGIDIAVYPAPHTFDLKLGMPARVLSVGRLSSTKNQMLVLEAFAAMQTAPLRSQLTVVGAPATDVDVSYEAKLKERAGQPDLVGKVTFLGGVSPDRMRDIYGANDLLLHASDTGSLDKVVLEALASGLRVVSTSDAFADGSLPVARTEKDPFTMASAALRSLEAPWGAAEARAAVASQHDLGGLIGKLHALLSPGR